MNNKDNSTIVIVLILAVVLLGSFILYDKGTKKTNPEENSNNVLVPTIDYTNIDIDTNIPLVCTIDMNNLNEVSVLEKCGDDFYATGESYQIRVTNLKYNEINYTYTYIWEQDTFYPREDAGIVKMYIGSNLISAHDGALRHIFWNIKTNENNLHIEEATGTDIPAFESDFDLSKIVK